VNGVPIRRRAALGSAKPAADVVPQTIPKRQKTQDQGARPTAAALHLANLDRLDSSVFNIRPFKLLAIKYHSRPADAMKDSTLGLCAHCRHAAKIESSKGSTFLLCQLSKSDPRFPKYPRLPVLACSGYDRSSPAGKGS
jgi:hypothetical protein